MSSWEELTEECYSSHTGTPFYIISIGLLTSLFIDCYMFFAGQTLATRCWMYARGIMCCYCCRKNQCHHATKHSTTSSTKSLSYPLIIHIASSNTADGRILDVCGYYKRHSQAPDGSYLYRSTFNSYIDESVLVLHYSIPPRITTSNRNTVIFSDRGTTASSSSPGSTRNRPQWMISAVDNSMISIDSVTTTEVTTNKAKIGLDDVDEDGSKLTSITSPLSSDGMFEFQQTPVIAVQSPSGRGLSSHTLGLQELSPVQSTTSTLLQSPAQLLLDVDREWIFEDQPCGDSMTLSVSRGNISFYTMNCIAILMVILAIYQLFVDGVALWRYIDDQNSGGDQDMVNRSFYDYQCYAVIITNSPSFKQIFIILSCLIVGRMNAVIFVKHLSVFRKVLGAVYMVYPVLSVPVLMTHTLPFFMLYLAPIVLIIGCVVMQWIKIKGLRQMTDSDGDGTDRVVKEEVIILVVGFALIFALYILSILSVSTMVRVYDGEGYVQSLRGALSERRSEDYFHRKLQGLRDVEEVIEMVYRLI